jgi:hypothetical protein
MAGVKCPVMYQRLKNSLEISMQISTLLFQLFVRRLPCFIRSGRSCRVGVCLEDLG